MIPLRASEPVQKFPRLALGLVFLFVAMDVVGRFIGPTHDTFLQSIAFIPAAPTWISAFSVLAHRNVFSLIVTLFYVWAFMPRLIERERPAFTLVGGATGAAVALFAYRAVHPFSEAPLIAPEALVGAWLGLSLRKDIWSSVDTIVIGFGWVRLFQVPSYVLLFFWLFYLLIGGLLTKAPFSDAPMPYLLPFISLLWGFVLSYLRDILTKWTLNSSSEKSCAKSNSSSGASSSSPESSR